ncbi:MAG TPA: hypothetical protein VK912_10115 [Longimicrobiales bacterium]|nr:hypothetical protein [Longimicrobiales bacterium]
MARRAFIGAFGLMVTGEAVVCRTQQQRAVLLARAVTPITGDTLVTPVIEFRGAGARNLEIGR